MGHARHIGRVGALAIALGIGAAVASPVAWAQPDTDGTGPSTASESASTPDSPADQESAATQPGDTEPADSDSRDTVVEAADPDNDSEADEPEAALTPRKKKTARSARTVTAPTDAPAQIERVADPEQPAQPLHAAEPAPQPEPVEPTPVTAAAEEVVPQSVPVPTAPTVTEVAGAAVTASTTPSAGGGQTTPPAAAPGLWTLLAAARREIGTTAAGQPVFGQPALDEPDPVTGAVNGRIVATDPDGQRLTYTVLVRPTQGTLTFNAGTFTYTPTAAQRILAGLSTVDPATFTVSVTDGRTPAVTTTVAIDINPTPAHLLNPITTGHQVSAVATTNNRAYLADSTAGTLTVVDTINGTVITTITVGADPVAVAVKPDGKTVYVAGAASRTLTVIDTATNTVRRQIALNFTPTALAMAPGGGSLYIGSATGKMAKLGTGSNRIQAWVANTAGATAIMVTPNGKRVYVTTATGVAAYSTASWWNHTAKTIAGTADSTALAISPDSRTVYAVAGDTVRVLETAKNTIISEFTTAGTVLGAAVSRDGSLLMLTGPDGAFTVYGTADHTALRSLDTGGTARGIATSPDGMQVYLTDGDALRVVSLVPPNLRPVVAPPAATGDPVTGVVTGSTGVTDADGDRLTITVTAAPTKGAITFAADGTFTYTATANRHKAAATTAKLTDLTDSVTITVDDGRRGVVQQTITLAVLPANTAPTYKLTVGRPNAGSGVITGTVSASDADKDRLIFDGTATTLGGTLVVGADGKFTYTPTVTARHAAATADPTARIHHLSITIDDGHGGIVTVPVAVTITPRNTAPSTATVTDLLAHNGTGRVTGTIAVSDADGDPLRFTVAAAPTRGTVALTADGSFGYTPTAAARAAGAGTDSFTVTVDDGHGATQTVTVSVGIAASTPGNTLPVTAAVAYTSSVNTVTGVVTGQIAVTDSSPLSYLLASATPTSGTLTVDADTGAFVFAPTVIARYRAWFTPGDDALTFTVSALDGQDGIPVDVTIPIAAVHPDVDGTLTLAELRNLASTGYLDVGRNAAGKVRTIDGTFTVDTVADTASAAALLNRISTLLGIPAGFATAVDISVSTNDFGSVFYRLRPTVNGLSVLGSEVVLSTDGAGRVTGLVNNYNPAITGVSTVPIGTVDRASKVIELVKNDLVSDLGGSPGATVREAFLATLRFDTELMIYAEDLNNAPQLAWRVNVTSAADSSYPSIGVRYVIAANGAEPGHIISEFSSAQHALAPVRSSGTDQLGKVRTVTAANTGTSIVLTDVTRNISTYATKYQSTWSNLPSIPGDVVGYTTSWLRSAVSAQANMVRVFDYYTAILGRDSFDDNGAAIQMSIDYNPSGSAARGWRNAAWTGSVMVFGDDGNTQAALDLVAHEYTHAVIQHINGLAYLGESGAMNESYADIMGALIENKTGGARWLFAEDAAGNPYRNMADPSDYRQPEHYANRYVDSCGCNADDDFDYVHSNSGILNFAAYKMMDATKEQISGEQWARVFYESLYRLPSTAKFVDARYAIIASARAFGFTAAQIDTVKGAFDAVGVVADRLI
ncbi:M4 family metallopeptidase [Mycolicibacterium bacteremicum]|uniref:Ig-like domain-containing protein n=1 Tax=Mycolicibacterium bacteremicum TaxID=564198 RepID=UPI0026F1C90D|nr:M4 family metallopeptidase [Mycolicibacterium bacteremicum]